MKKTTITLLLLGWSLQFAFGQDYLCQPYFQARQLKFYLKTNVATNYTDSLDQDIKSNFGGITSGGPNSVVIYKDKLFVSLDFFGGKGGVLIYRLADLLPTKSSNPPYRVIKPGNADGFASIGIAIQPSTGDLYIPTAGNGIWKSTANSGYSTATDLGIPAPTKKGFCANLAFDASGNLWMTAFDINSMPAAHILVCFKGANPNEPYIIGNSPSPTYVAVNNPNPCHLLSAPEGLAFDAAGNLYLANNNEDGYRTNPSGFGTLVKLKASAINGILLGASSTNPRQVSTTDVEIYHISNGKLGGLLIDGNNLYINDQGNGIVYKWDVTTSFPSSLPSSGISTTAPGNGAADMLRDYANIHGKDNPTDPATSPNKTTTIAWESTDIWIRKASSSQASSVHESPNGAEQCSVYVRVRNNGFAPTKGTEILKLYWAKASTSLGWPSPWDGIGVGTQGGKVMGGRIDSDKPIPVIPAGGSTIIALPWVAPDPNTFSGVIGSAGDQHFCLLARIETTPNAPYGMHIPEVVGGGTDLVSNALNNSHIFWRNVEVIKTAPASNPHVLLGNYGKVRKHCKVSFEILDAQTNPMDLSKGKLTLQFEGDNREKLMGMDFNRQLMQDLGDGRFAVNDLANSLDHIHLDPGDHLAFAVQYEPAQSMEGYAIRAIESVYTDSSTVIEGGQTFAFGEVPAFTKNTLPTPNPDPETCNSNWLGLPCWAWIAIAAALLLLIVLILILRRRS